MNLTEFRDQLAARADQPQADPLPDPLPVLRGRIRAVKRRRTAVTAAGAVLAVAVAATVIPAGLDRRGNPEPAPASPGPADVVNGPIRFPGTIGGDTLAEARIGEVGQEFSFEFTAPPGETEVRPVCDLAGKTADYARSPYWVHVFVNGRMLVTSPCGAGQGATAGLQYWSYWVKPGHPGVNLEGLEAGRPARITVRVGRNDPAATHAPNRRARVGVGIYRLGPMRVVERASAEGDRIPEVVDHQGHRYRLVDVRTRLATDGAAVTVDTPADIPFLVRYFAIVSGQDGQDKPAVRTLRLTGLGAPISVTQRYDPKAELARELPKIDPIRVDARPAGQVTITLDGPDARNLKLLLAVYRQER